MEIDEIIKVEKNAQDDSLESHPCLRVHRDKKTTKVRQSKGGGGRGNSKGKGENQRGCGQLCLVLQEGREREWESAAGHVY